MNRAYEPLLGGVLHGGVLYHQMGTGELVVVDAIAHGEVGIVGGPKSARLRPYTQLNRSSQLMIE
jgi:hypothetical protein